MSTTNFFVMEQSKKLHRKEKEISDAKREIVEIDKKLTRYEDNEENVGVIHKLLSRKKTLKQRIYFDTVQVQKLRKMGIR